MSRPTGSRARIDVALPVSEFPDWLNPVFVRDLRQGLRDSFLVWVFVLLQGLALIMAVAEWAIATLFGDTGAGSVFADAFPIVATLVFRFLLPFSLFNALQPELGRGRNAELLLTSRLTRWQIVRGKLLVATTLSSLLLISLFPYFLIRYFLGGVEPGELFAVMWGLLIANLVMNAIVIGASAFGTHLVRFALIFFLMSFHSMTAAAYTMGGGLAGYRGFSFPLDTFVGESLTSGIFVILSLQLGRAKLQPVAHGIPPTALVLVFLFLTSVAHGIIAAMGGSTLAFFLLCLALAGALLLNRDQHVKKS